ncbi:MAG: hypothetical protein RSE00_01840 [Clostridia bacterium]
MKKRFLLAMSLVVFLAIVATIVIYVDKYQTSQEFETKKYIKEVDGILNLVENQQVIKIVKDDLNKDTVKDYIVLTGKEKYKDTSSTNTEALKIVSSELSQYENVGIIYVDGTTKDVIKHETNKIFDKDIDLKVLQDSATQYIVVNDISNADIIITTLKDGKLIDIISKNFGQDFKGYDIKATFNQQDATKLNVKLDNFGRDYLPEKTDDYTIDFTNTKVNKDTYRQSYTPDKYSRIILEDGALDDKLRLKCIQDILYQTLTTPINTSKTANNVDPYKTAGIVKSEYILEGESLVLQGVFVEK